MRAGIATGLVLLALAACKPMPVTNQAEAGGEGNVTVAAVPRTEEQLQLSPYGLLIADKAGKMARALTFGMPREAVMAEAAALLGKATAQGTSPECPGGEVATADFPGGLSLVFAEGKFVGWDAGGNPRGLATASGIHVGSTRAELARAYDIAVEQSTLGTEFSVARLGGILASPAPDARIQNLWAGRVCVYR